MLTLGGQPAFCDTFFDNVRVPAANLLGPIHDGWRLAKALLGHERTLVGAVGPIRRQLRHAKRICTEQGLGEDPHWRRRIAKLEMRVRAHQMANYRAVAAQQAGRHPGPETSILKLVGSTLQQEADELCMDLLGPDSVSFLNETASDAVTERYCYNRATTIYAGSNEIQRNIIARWVLGLPKGA
jgi:alkylation response protein AidB-like acyl-CoA dehydrogenase